MKRKILCPLILVFSFAVIAIYSKEEKIIFNMATGRSLNNYYVFGVNFRTLEINNQVHKYSIIFDLLDKNNPSIVIRKDKNLKFVRMSYYSKVSSDYFDLVSTARIMDKTDSTDILHSDNKDIFIKLWNGLLISASSKPTSPPGGP
jgi:hypothetical protein